MGSSIDFNEGHFVCRNSDMARQPLGDVLDKFYTASEDSEGAFKPGSDIASLASNSNITLHDFQIRG